MSEQPEPKQMSREEKMAEMLQHKEKMMPLVRYLKKHGLKFKVATCNKARVEYFRVDQYRNLIEENKE